MSHPTQAVRRHAPALATTMALALVSGCGGDDPPPPPPAEETPDAGAVGGADGGNGGGGGATRPVRTDGEPRLETVVTDLEVPWELVFLPDGRALVTERPGRIRVITEDFELLDEPAAEVPAAATGEGGLLGLALDPAFERNDLVYAYYTAGEENVVARYRLEEDTLEEEAIVLDGIVAAPIHDGGRIRFGPDDRLYVSTGDAAQEELAQDEDSLNGKFLALDEGDYRADSPSEPEILTIGHRNPQGFDWQPNSDRLIATEHGATGNDEVNEIVEGENYGWPIVEGTDHGEFEAPLTVYEDSIAPSGGAFVTMPGSEWTGDFLFGALVGEQVRRLSFDGGRIAEDEALFEDELGRVRTVVEGPDGALYALTNNTDGRGSPREGDDRIVRIIPPAD